MTGSAAAATGSQRREAPPWLRALATALWLVGIGLAAAIVVMRLQLAPSAKDPFAFPLFGAIAAVMVVYGVLGRLLVARRPRQRIGWIFLATPVAVGLVFGGFTTMDWALATGRIGAPIFAYIGIIGPVCFAPALLLAFPMLAIYFPDGRLPSPRWRWPVRIVIAMALTSSLAILGFDGQLDPTLPRNPFGIPGSRDAMFIVQALTVSESIIAGIILGILAIIVRLRRGRPDERRQLAWFLGAVLIVVAFAIPTFDAPNNWLNVISALSLALLPATVTLAILRYHLYDIDRIVSRTIGYAVVTAVLVAVFAGAVLGLQNVLAGVTRGDTVPVAMSTLLVFALFQPLRRRVQHVVDRRFDRARIDADATLRRFAGEVRDELDLAAIRHSLRQAAAHTLAPAATSVWLRDRGRG